MSYAYKEKCKRFTCLYHPGSGCLNGCDYMILTGNKRECSSGKECQKYEYATDEKRIRLECRLIEEFC